MKLIFEFFRLRRRNAHVRFEEEPEIINGLQRPPPASSRTREALSWMVDQMRIDQAANANSDASPEHSRSVPERPGPVGAERNQPPRSGVPGNAGAPPWLSIGELYGSDHASFRSRYVNRIRTEDNPRMHYRFVKKKNPVCPETPCTVYTIHFFRTPPDFWKMSNISNFNIYYFKFQK